VDNRLSDGTYSDHAYNADNQLTSYDSTTYTYDNNGNTISKTDVTGTTYYTYDPENRLTRIDFPDGTYATYQYDPFGRRIQKNVNGTITQYLYDGEDILAEYDATNTRIVRYTHGPGIDEPLIMERGGQSYYYHADGLGSITEITDATGNIVNSYVYNSFGKIVKETEAVQNSYTYTARERDKESGLYFYRARYYDPAIGRFLQPDPIGFLGGDINLYNYVANNPVNYIDPEGKSLILGGIAIGIVINIIINTNYNQDPCGNITINIPPPSMWKKGIRLPFFFGVQMTGQTGKGGFGTPTGFGITMDPSVNPSSGGTGGNGYL